VPGQWQIGGVWCACLCVASSRKESGSLNLCHLSLSFLVGIVWCLSRGEILFLAIGAREVYGFQPVAETGSRWSGGQMTAQGGATTPRRRHSLSKRWISRSQQTRLPVWGLAPRDVALPISLGLCLPWGWRCRIPRSARTLNRSYKYSYPDSPMISCIVVIAVLQGCVPRASLAAARPLYSNRYAYSTRAHHQPLIVAPRLRVKIE